MGGSWESRPLYFLTKEQKCPFNSAMSTDLQVLKKHQVWPMTLNAL